jgi:hypothetical protein
MCIATIKMRGWIHDALAIVADYESTSMDGKPREPRFSSVFSGASEE